MTTTRASDPERGSALILILLVGAVLGSATLAALVFLQPSRGYEEHRDLVRLRLDAVERALRAYHLENSTFPTTLETLDQQGLVHPLALEDPFKKGTKLGYAVEGSAPEIAKIWSVGWNGKDESGSGDDVARSIPGALAGSPDNLDRFKLLKRAVAARNTTGTPYGESDLISKNRGLLEDIDEKIDEAVGKMNEKPNDFDEWAEKSLEVFEVIAEKIKKSYEKRCFSNRAYLAPVDAVEDVEHEVKKMAEKSERWTTSYFDDEVAPEVAQARSTISGASITESARSAFTDLVDSLESYAQTMSGGSGFNTSSFRAWVQSEFTDDRSQAIQAMLEAQGLPVSGPQWFLDGYDSMVDAVAALGLPAAFAYDAWGTLLSLDKSGSSPVVKSAGPDRQFGTADDLTLSW